MRKAKEAIRVSGLTKIYNGKKVLDGLNLSVKNGTVFGLLGANGAGKSTTIECILGTRRAEQGTALVLGRDPGKERRALFQKVGVQFQEGDYQPEIKVSEICEEIACLYDSPSDWRELCERFGIGDKLKNAVKSLSGGERQRLFIALALIPAPELVFLDELTTGLTIFLTSHFMDEVEALCDEVCILKKGKTVFYGTIEQAKEQSGCEKFEDAYLKFSDEEADA